MHRRIDHSKLSFPFFNSLISLGEVTYKPASANYPTSNSHRQLERSFLQRILPKIPVRCKITIPHLTSIALRYNKDSVPVPIYTAETCNEFHSVLCALLCGIRDALEGLKVYRPSQGMEPLKTLVRDVFFHGMALHAMAYSSWMEIHLQSIADLLVLAHSRLSKSQTAQPVEELDDDIELQGVQPRTIQGDHPLSIWEAYRDWLRLMVSYFDAARTISNYINVYRPSSISIQVVAIPFQGQEMLPWTQLVSMFFETREVDAPSNIDSTSASAPASPTPRSEALEFADFDPVFTDPLLTDDSSVSASDDTTDSEMENLTKDAAWVTKLQDITSAAEFVRAIEILRKSSPYFERKFGPTSPLSMGDRFGGTAHCESIIACFIYASAFARETIHEDLCQEFSVCQS